jgi:hypothetical protein
MKKNGDRSCGLCNMAISLHKEEGNPILNSLEGVSGFKCYEMHNIHDRFHFPLERIFVRNLSRITRLVP